MITRAAIVAAAALLMAGPASSEDRSGPTDAEIAHIAYTAGQLDLEAGKQALAKAETQQIRAFAQTMMRDHQAVNEQALALVKKLGVTPKDNPTSQALVTQARLDTGRLNALSGSAFDRAYIANEAAFHRTVNHALRTKLIPSADNAELKALLESGLILFQAHQQHAEQLAAAVK